ncbi:hypothetical protein [Cupriavidus sp. amp6]|uniref:hypothetical protein n=1 Tax=Cupriavidus sp. amp6 TaxID=388051 RepID=UPI0012EC3758|nr:hypothetical protein [Cupriavidus sp. amp6]
MSSKESLVQRLDALLRAVAAGDPEAVKLRADLEQELAKADRRVTKLRESKHPVSHITRQNFVLAAREVVKHDELCNAANLIKRWPHGVQAPSRSYLDKILSDQWLVRGFDDVPTEE